MLEPEELQYEYDSLTLRLSSVKFPEGIGKLQPGIYKSWVMPEITLFPQAEALGLCLHRVLHCAAATCFGLLVFPPCVSSQHRK